MQQIILVKTQVFVFAVDVLCQVLYTKNFFLLTYCKCHLLYYLCERIAQIAVCLFD